MRRSGAVSSARQALRKEQSRLGPDRWQNRRFCSDRWHRRADAV